MNWERVSGRWTEYKGRVREYWGKLTDDDLELIAGRREQLIGVLMQRYGYAREIAEWEVGQFCQDGESV